MALSIMYNECMHDASHTRDLFSQSTHYKKCLSIPRYDSDSKMCIEKVMATVSSVLDSVLDIGKLCQGSIGEDRCGNI